MAWKSLSRFPSVNAKPAIKRGTCLGLQQAKLMTAEIRLKRKYIHKLAHWHIHTCGHTHIFTHICANRVDISEKKIFIPMLFFFLFDGF